MISFARRLIRHGSSSGNTLKPNSAKCCVLTVARRLGSLLEERDPAILAPETLEDLYVRAIDDAAKDSENPRRLQATVAWTMREFHRHLVRDRAAKPLNEADVFRVPRGFLTVDATMVSVEDVYSTLDYLCYEPHPSWSDRNREIARMQTLLGFFAGLRTMEGLGASRRDFPGGAHLPFLVLPSEERSLKTANARRMIPVSIFMEPFNDLAEHAGKWVQQISELNNDDRSSRLFGEASDDVIIPMIGEALRAVTGNDRVRYYTLRHSFASWTLTRLLLSQFPDVPDLFPHLPLTTRWLQDSKQFRSRLYGNDCVDNDHAWAVATLMGHSSPSVSFASYCHTLDILLPQFLQRSHGLSAVLAARARLRLSSVDGRSCGYNKLPANRNASEDGATAPVPDLSFANPGRDERQFALDQLRNRYPALAATLVQLKPVRDRSWLEQTWGLLYMSTKPDCEFGKLVPYLGIDLEEATRIVEHGRAICALRSATTNENLHTVVTAEMQSGGSRVAAYPRRPDAKAMAIATRLADRISVTVRKEGSTGCTVLDYYCRNVLPNSASLVFTSCEFEGLKTPDLVREYCRLLVSFGVHRRDLLFEGADGTARKFPRVDWYSQWGLRSRSSCKIANWHGKKAARIVPGEWLAITSRRGRRDDKEYERPFFDAFRFVLLLAAIRFGGISEAQ
jgi:integrase